MNHKAQLGDIVKVELKRAYDSTENTLAYVLAGELPPSVIPEHQLVTLTTTKMVDDYNAGLTTPPDGA